MRSPLVRSRVRSVSKDGLAHPPFRVHKARLRNGLRLSVVETPHLHSAVVSLYVRAGSRFETAATNGLSHFVEHMLFRGSREHPSSYALNRAIEERGGTLYAETGRDHSLYQIAVQPDELGSALAILGELFTAPVFGDIDLERAIILEELLEDLDDRGRNVNAHDLSRELAWPAGHPLGFPVIGPRKNVRGFSRGDVQRHFDQFYGGRNMVLAISGRVTFADVAAMARRAFDGVSAGRRVLPRPARPLLGGPRFRAVWDDTAQTQIHLVYHALPEGDPDYPALAALLRLLDDGMSTPLHYRICDQKGLAYHVAAGLEPLHDATLVDIEAACSHAKLQDLVAEVLAILDGFRRELVPADELEKARRRYLGDLEAGFDDIDALGAWFGGTELFYAPLSHAERARRMMRVTAEDVRRVARRVIRPSRLSATAVGALEPAVARRVRRILAGDGDVVNLPAARRRPR